MCLFINWHLIEWVFPVQNETLETERLEPSWRIIFCVLQNFHKTVKNCYSAPQETHFHTKHDTNWVVFPVKNATNITEMSLKGGSWEVNITHSRCIFYAQLLYLWGRIIFKWMKAIIVKPFIHHRMSFDVYFVTWRVIFTLCLYMENLNSVIFNYWLQKLHQCL